jgi:hypothetical protein
MMLDNEAIKLREEALALGMVLDAMSIPIIPWGSDCCSGCENYQCGKSELAHGYCPIQHRRVSPHYFCEAYEQD